MSALHSTADGALLRGPVGTETAASDAAAASVPMRIAYLVNQYPKPSHSFIRREIAGVEARGHVVERYTIRRSSDPCVDPADIAESGRTRVVLDGGALGLAVDVLALVLTRPVRTLRALREALDLSRGSRAGLAKHLAYFAEACRLARWLARSGAAHLHAHFGTNSTAVALLCHTLGGPPFSFTAHGTESFEAPREIGLKAKLRAARFAVAVCDYGRKELETLADPATSTPIHVVRCGVDDGFLAARPIAIPSAERLVCVARFSPEKGLFVLLDAFARVHAKRPSARLVLVGDGDLRGEIEARIARHGLADAVVLAGWCAGDRVREEIVASRALVLPSFAEGLPVVVLEALALGRPVVASAVCGIPEIVADGVDGFLVKPSDVEALANALERVLAASPAELDALGAAGRERVRARHDARREAASLARRFEELHTSGGTR